MDLQDLETQIITNMPDGYGYQTGTVRLNNKFFTTISIKKHGFVVEAAREDSLYFALKYISEYFINLKK